jgi:Fe-S cluster assembly ATP-binding protein
VMVDGAIALSGGRELAEELEAKGYDWVRVGIANAA